jgi:hypothetical protein
MMVPIISCEFHGSIGEFRQAATCCGWAINRITQLWKGNQTMKAIVLALLYERLAGVLVNPRRSALATARAGMCYHQAYPAVLDLAAPGTSAGQLDPSVPRGLGREGGHSARAQTIETVAEGLH